MAINISNKKREEPILLRKSFFALTAAQRTYAIVPSRGLGEAIPLEKSGSIFAVRFVWRWMNARLTTCIFGFQEMDILETENN